MGLSTNTVADTSTTTAAATRLPPRVYAILLRAPSANTDAVHISLGSTTATTGDLKLSAGESFSLDISTALSLKMQMGENLNDNDFIGVYAQRAASGTQTILRDLFTL